MRVISYLPKDPAAMQELQKGLAEVHADMVLRRISELKCPKEQKLAILDAVIAKINSELLSIP